jgi:hypothetical protein
MLNDERNVDIILIVEKITDIYNDAGFKSVKLTKLRPNLQEQYQKKHMEAKNIWKTTNCLPLRRDIRKMLAKNYLPL